MVPVVVVGGGWILGSIYGSILLLESRLTHHTEQAQPNTVQRQHDTQPHTTQNIALMMSLIPDGGGKSNARSSCPASATRAA